MTSSAKGLLLDRAAIGLSMLCVIHCLALPLLLALLPSITALPISDERFHLALLLLILPTSTIALFLGCRRHRDHSVLVWGVSGIVVLIVTALVGHDLFGDAGEKIMTVVGAVLVAVGHIRNFRLCRTHACTQ